MQWDDRVLKVQNVMDGVRERESEEHAIIPSNTRCCSKSFRQNDNNAVVIIA